MDHEEQLPEPKHWSDCAVHNMPAYPNGECNCGGFVPTQELDKERT